MTVRLAESRNPLGGVDQRCRVRARLQSGLVLARRGDRRRDRGGGRPLRGPPRPARRRGPRRAGGTGRGAGPPRGRGGEPSLAHSRGRPGPPAREAAARRAAQHRAARGEGQGAGRPAHRGPRSRGDARNVFPRFAENARVLRQAYLTLAEDVHRGEFVTAGRGVAARQLPPRRRRDPRRAAEPAARLLPRAAQARRPRAEGDARVYAMAVELIRHSDSRLDRQQLAPLPDQLPDGGAAHDRRAVGVAEHAQARPHREPAAPGGRG